MSQKIPTLIQYLRQKLSDAMSDPKQKAQFQARSKAAGSVDAFCEFCEVCLDANPVVQTFFPGVSIGLIMADSGRVVMNRQGQTMGVSEPTQRMQPDTSISVTSGEEGFGKLPE